jgi:hypothetical protein
MKKIKDFKYLMQMSFLVVVVFTLTGNLQAQEVEPRKGTVSHNDGERPCLVVNLDPEPKPLKKAWKSFLKDNYDLKIKGIGFLTNKDLLYKEDIVVEAISSKRMDFYTKIVEDEVGSEMKVFISFGYDIYVDQNETPEEFKIMKKMVNDFLESYLPKYYQSEVKATKKKVKKLTKSVSGLEKDISKNKKDIEDHKEEIEELAQEVAEKQSELETANVKLKERREKLQRINEKFK